MDITDTIAVDDRPVSQTGSLLVVRTGPFVALTFADLVLARTAWTTIAYLSAGLRPIASLPTAVDIAATDATVTGRSSLIIRSSGALSIRSSANEKHRGHFTFLASGAMP